MKPVLYILMRADMRSMNPGKAMAQASHASNQFVAEYQGFCKESKWHKHANCSVELYNCWLSGKTVGTVLVLEVNEEQMNTAVMVAKSAGFISSVVHDPTYPLRDGDTTHFIPVDTCAYVFGNKEDSNLGLVVQDFELHY